MHETSKQPIILWCGRVSRIGGYRSVTLNHAKGLMEQGARIALFDLDHLKFVGPDVSSILQVTYDGGGGVVRCRPHNPDDFVVVVVHERPDQFNRIIGNGRVRIIGHTVFETERLPTEWNEMIASLDEVWVASEYNRLSFINSGVPAFMIRKFPHSLDTSTYGKDIGKMRFAGDGEIAFLTVCSALIRRDLELGVRAFLRAFSNEESVRYIIKLAGVAARPDSVRLIRSMLKESVLPYGDRPKMLNKIVLLTRDLSDEDMIRVYQGCDVYVSVERANGWDMPTMEAMACGKPVIRFNVGGSTEYCDESVAVSLPVLKSATQIPTAGYHPFYTGQWWPVVDGNTMTEAMLKLANIGLRNKLGAAARRRIEAEYDANVVAKSIIAHVRRTKVTDYRSNCPATVVIGKNPVWRNSTLNPQSISDFFSGFLSQSIVETRNFIRRLPSADLQGILKHAASDPVTQALREWGSIPWAQMPRKIRIMCRILALSRRKVKAVKRQGNGTIFRGLRGMYSAEYNPAYKITKGDIEARRRSVEKYPLIPIFNSEKSKLASLRNQYWGERCFIIGNGPSLNEIDLSKLAKERTFGVNKIYLLFDRIDWRPSFYTVLDWRMGPAVAPHVKEMPDSLKFIPNRFRGLWPTDDSTYWFMPRPVLDHIKDQFRVDIVDGIPSKGTILMTAIQIAFFLGFRDIYLIGVDANYSIPDTVIQTGPDMFRTGTKLYLQSVKADDPNHFDSSYFGAGDEWHDPNVDEMIRQFRNMRKGVELHGGRIRNATKGGKLEVFERVDYDSLFST